LLEDSENKEVVVEAAEIEHECTQSEIEEEPMSSPEENKVDSLLEEDKDNSILSTIETLLDDLLSDTVDTRADHLAPAKRLPQVPSLAIPNAGD
jgi:hypothetical protein